MALFSFKRGKIDKWYKQELKKLNDNYFSYQDPGGTSGNSELQRANTRSKELEKATADLKQEYRAKLKEIGQKPRSDFLNTIEEN
ncbi:MAG: hypothetical protein JWP00_2107 [Chloroflexi bacterium]|jgi:DNA polymerase sigma|nr:hypothetical protein [Chloroflexota bacterium]